MSDPAASGILYGGPAQEALVYSEVIFTDPVDPDRFFIVGQTATDTRSPDELAMIAMAAGGPVLSSNAFLAFEQTLTVRFDMDGLLDGEPARAQGLFSGPLNVFAFETDGGRRALTFFGEGDPEFWSDTTISGQRRALSFSIDPGLLTGRDSPIGATDSGLSDAALLLVSGPQGRFVEGPSSPAGVNRDAIGRAFTGYVSIEGAGPAQRSEVGAGVNAILPSTAGLASFGVPVLATGRGAGAAPVSQGRALLGTLDAGDGVTAFGDGTKYFLLGAAAPYVTNDLPDLDVVADFRSIAGFEDATFFGDTRIAQQSGNPVVPANRTPLAQPLGASTLATSAPAGVDTVFTGGFAVIGGNSVQPGGVGLGAPYMLLGREPASVLVGFDADRNDVVAEIGLLNPSGSTTPLFDVRRVFGGVGAVDAPLGAFLDDNRFAAMGTLLSLSLTGQNSGASDRIIAPSLAPGLTANDFTIFSSHGGFVSRGLVGDGGLFPAGTNTDPQFLRWGWWNDEIAFLPDPFDPDFDNRQERLHLGGWVTGVLSDVADVSALTGSATFEGFALAQVIEVTPAGPAAYVEGGQFTLGYNFGTQVGGFLLEILDGPYVAQIVSGSGAAAGNHFGGEFNLGFFFGPGSGRVDGSFFADSDDPVAAAAGAFSLSSNRSSGNAFSAAGIFGGDRDGPVAPPTIVPVDTLVGSRFFLDNASSVSGTSIPATLNLVFQPSGPTDVFTSFERDIGMTPTTLIGQLQFGGEVTASEGLIFQFADSGTTRTADIVLQPSVERFLLKAEANDPVPFRFLQVIGEPTDPTLFDPDPISAGALSAEVYRATDELFSFTALPLPRGAPLASQMAQMEFFIVGDVDGTQPLETSADRLFSAFLVEEGSGPLQRTALGAFIADPTRNADGYPVLEGGVAENSYGVFVRDGGLSRGEAPYDLVEVVGGVTSFGPEAEVLLLGGASNLSSGAGETAIAFFDQPLGGGGDGPELFGDTRLLIFEQNRFFDALNRTPSAIPVSASPFASTASPEIQTVLTGGYAIAASEADLSAPYLISSANPADVRIGFAPGRNEVAVEFGGLSNVGGFSASNALSFGIPINNLTLNFDGAFINDELFVARHARDEDGRLSGQAIGESGRILQGPGDFGQEAFVGVLSSDPVVAEMSPSPEFLRWGHWAGELRADPGESPEIERIGHGFWVAGVRSDISEVLGASGSATYEGVALANVVENSARTGGLTQTYTERGTVNMSYDFAQTSGNGDITITGILSPVASAFVVSLNQEVQPGGPHYTGGVGSSGGGTTIDVAVSGAFFSGNSDPVAATAGKFTIDATVNADQYQAVGIYAADVATRTGP